MSRRGLLVGGITLALMLGGPIPLATAAPKAPEAPLATERQPVTPTITSIQAQAALSAKSTSVGGQTVLAEVSARDTTAFNLVGASWSSLKGDVTLQVQTKTAAGWSGWVDLSAERSADVGDVPGNSVADPSYVGEASGIALRALGGAGASIAGLSVKTVTSPAVADDAHLGTVTAKSVATLGVPQPSIVSRAGWGANESLRTSCSNGTYDTTVKAAVIHHTAGANDYTAAESPAIVRATYAYHVQTNGWCDIGYNFLIDKYGTIFEGRFGGIEKPVHGAHAGSWNTNTMGVSFMMNTMSVQPSDASMQSAVSLLAWKLGGYYRDPEGSTTLVGATQRVILAHGDVMATACPGTYLWARLQELRDRTFNEMAGRQKTPLYSWWVAAGSDSSRLGPVSQVERTVGTGRVVTFQDGGAYQRSDGQVFWLGAGLDALYTAQGGPTGSLGWPTSSQVADGAKVKATFEHGSLTSGNQDPYASFVKATYQDFLGRPASQGEVDIQRAALRSGSTSQWDYLSSLANSNEWLSSIVTAMYRNTLEREPDAAGLATWVSWLRSGRFTVAQAAGLFYASEEYYVAHAGGSPTAWVTALYQKILHRAPDAAGLQYWVSLTNNPAYGRAYVAYVFYQSSESRNSRVQSLYLALLGREPDPTGWPYWASQVYSTGDVTLAMNLANSQEYLIRALSRY